MVVEACPAQNDYWVGSEAVTVEQAITVQPMMMIAQQGVETEFRKLHHCKICCEGSDG